MNKSEISLIEIKSKKLKQPTTIEQQIELLEARKLKIEDKNFARDFLKRFNYYFVTGYLYPYKNSDDTYSTNISFNKITLQIKFDMRLREIFMYCIDIIEKTLKTTIAYHFSHNYEYGNIAYSESYFFPGYEEKHKKLMNYYNKSLENNKDLPFVEHNKKRYGLLPTWVAIELFTLGNLENFFEILNTTTVQEIEKVIGFPKNKIKNWIKHTRIFRNMVAHNQRLYNFPIISTPIKPKEIKIQTGRIFDYIVIIKLLFKDTQDWNEYVIPRLEYVLEDFITNDTEIKLECIGFPNNWKEILKK